jgi:hypothetical protein
VDGYGDELRLMDSAARFHVVALVGDKEETDCSMKNLLHLEEPEARVENWEANATRNVD